MILKNLTQKVKKKPTTTTTTVVEEKHEANREMLYNLSLIQNPTLREKVDRFIVKKTYCASCLHWPWTHHHLQRPPPARLAQPSQNLQQRILRWALLLSEYVLTVKHVKGVENRRADLLSRHLVDKEHQS